MISPATQEFTVIYMYVCIYAVHVQYLALVFLYLQVWISLWQQYQQIWMLAQGPVGSEEGLSL